MKARPWLEGVAACGLVLYPPVGAALFFLHSLTSGRPTVSRSWLWLWSALLALGLWIMLQGRLDLWLLAQAGLALLLALFVTIKSARAALLGIIAGFGFVLIVAAGGLERELPRHLWMDAGSPQAFTDKLQGVTSLSGDSIVPGEEWQGYTLTVEREALRALGGAVFVLHLEAGADVALRDMALVSLTPNTGQPLPHAFPRSGLWHPNVNLAGHTFAAAGLLLLLLTRAPWMLLGSIFIVLGAIFVTGSRTAWLAALAGLPWLLWLGTQGRARLLAFGSLALITIAFFLGVGGEALGRLQLWQGEDGNAVTRVEIWGFAWDTLSAQPRTGVGKEGFVSAWQARHPDDRREVPTHAHNFWLQFGAAHGIPGLAAALWLTAGLLAAAWRWGRWRGLGLVVPVLMMQVFDYTLFYAGVLFPLILGLNMLRDERSKG